MIIWHIREPDPILVLKLQKEFHAPEIIARVLANRNIRSLEESRPFFSPDLSQLHDPFLMLNMEKAAERVVKQIHKKGKIFIFGDYDVDGTSGVSVLYLTLNSLGADVKAYIPDRKKEGYGLSEHGIDVAVGFGADLLITCDCGINAFQPIEYANRKKVDVIITDHHTPDPKLPNAYAVLNPNQKNCTYPFKGLCGAGVAFKLAFAVEQIMGHQDIQAFQHLDLVTLGTAADLVPILDENRVIVSHGLKLLENPDKPGLRALLDVSGLSDKTLTVWNLVFGLAPRINAAGRMGDANRAVKLFIEDDFFECVRLAKALDKENSIRKTIQETIVEEALFKVNTEVDLDKDRAIVLWDNTWHPGVIGIVASRIKEEFHRPVIIISTDSDPGKGSARSIHNFDLYLKLSKCADNLEGFGGHPMAAGLTISVKNLNNFRQAFINIANESLSDDDLVKTLDVEGEMSLNIIDKRFMSFLHKLAPYGPGNMRPVFVTKGIQSSGTPRLVGNGDHLKFTAKQNGKSIDAIGFNMANHYEHLITGNPIDIAYVIEENEWQGVKSIQLNIRDIKPMKVNTL